MRMRGILVAVLAVVALLGAAKPAPRPAPVLRLELGMHTALINRIAVDAAGRTLVTGSDDKTVRVWDAQDGRQLQVLRLPSGAGPDGQVYAVALSPDGALVAAGGMTGTAEEKVSLYLFERASGTLRRLRGLPKAIKRLAFSREGRRLAAVLGEGHGLRVVNVADSALVGQDTACGADSYGVDFDSAGRLVTSCDDGTLRLYDAALRPLAQVATRAGKRPMAVSFAPDGGLVAVGFDDSTAVEVYSGKDLSLRHQPDTTGVDNGDLSSVVWSRDGSRLCAGGRWDVAGKHSIRCWQRGGQGPFNDTPVADHTIMDLVALPEGRVAFAAGDPAWGVLDPQRPAQAPAPLRRSPLADLRGVTLRLDEKGQTLAFGYEQWGQAPATFSLPGRRLVQGDPERSLAPPRTEAPGLTLTPWQGTTEVRLNGRPLPLEPYEPSFSLALSADGRSLLLGSAWSLRLLDAQGTLRWRKPVPGAAWGVNLSANGRLAVAAFGDGTLRWFSTRDGTELLAFFPHADRKRWLLWTPAGYYDASPGAEDLMGWVIDRGRDQPPDFFTASRFQKRLYRPDIISRALDRDAPEPPPDTPLVLPPVVRILSPRPGDTLAAGDTTVRLALRPGDDNSLARLVLQLDGRPLLSLQHRGLPPGEHALTLPLPLPGPTATLSVLAYGADDRASDPATVTLRGSGPPPAEPPRADLYVLAVGTGQNPKVPPRLDYAGADARALARVLRRQEGHLYQKVHPVTLEEGQADRRAIIKALATLRRQARRVDTVLVFLAGHGLSDGQGYFFVPADGDPAETEGTMIAGSQLRELLLGIAGRKVLLLDTCYAAGAMRGTRGGTLNMLVNQLARPEDGIVVYSASQETQLAREKPAWGHGAFTLALLEALGEKPLDQGDAAARQTTAALLSTMRGAGRVTLASLNLYLSERVRALTGGQQQTGLASPERTLSGDTPIAYLPKD